MSVLKEVGKDAHWEGHYWGGRGLRKKGQRLQKHPVSQSSNVSQAWTNTVGSNPSALGSRFSKWFNSMSHFWKKKIHTVALVLCLTSFYLMKLGWVFSKILPVNLKG